MIEDYEKAKRLGDRAVRQSLITGKYPFLPALDDMLALEDQTSIQKLGLIEVPIDTIVGTKTAGRQNSFANNFMPILKSNTEFAFKWSSLYDSHMAEGIREPIIAFEYMYKFYVQEGNKRVSVSSFTGITDMLANVTRIMPKRTEETENKIYYEFVDFYEVCPLYGIYFTKEGSYAKLAQLLGQDMKHAWSEDFIKDLKSGFHAFEREFIAKGGEKLGMTSGDAFLVYLNIYPLNNLVYEPRALYEKQIEKVWNEITLTGKVDQVTLVETPQEAPIESRGMWKNLVRPHYYSKENPLRVAFLYDKDPEVSSWTYSHELGRMSLNEKFAGAVDAIAFKNCDTPQKIREAIDSAAADENRIIFTTSMTMMEETLKSAIHYPEIQFFNCSINMVHNAVQTYYARMYEAKFMMGALAASMAENHKIAYRAQMPVYGAIADINAFAIGAAMIDPKAKIYLHWSSAQSKMEWAQLLADEKIRVISGLEMIRPNSANREFGLFMINEENQIENLAAPIWDWGKYYEQILRPVVVGMTDYKMSGNKDQAMNFWWGMNGQVIDVITSSHLSYYSRKTMDVIREALMSGRLSPFDGELRSQDGIIKTANSPRLSSEEILTMDWLNDNIVGRIPTKSELIPEVKAAVEVSGVKAED